MSRHFSGGMCAVVAALVLFNLVGSSFGQSFSLSGLITDNMVFQRNEPINVWGWGVPNSKINVTLGTAQPVDTYVAANGSWTASLPAQQAGGPFVLSVGHTEGMTYLKNVYVGEVLLCSGQSKMEFTVSQSFNATAEIAAAANYGLIRLYTVNQNTSYTPLYNVSAMGGGWLVASPATVGYGNWSYFSAVCYYTGRRLYDFLATQSTPVAVGLVCSRWGGTEVQAWQDAEALSKCPAPNSTHRAHKAAHENEHKQEFTDLAQTRTNTDVEAGPNPNTNSVLWNAMIVPLLPFRFKAALWDQAEQNVGDESYYGCWFKNMILSWRQTFDSPNLGFFFVQLPGYGSANGWTPLALMRLQQAEALTLPLVAMAVTYDVPDPSSPFGTVHTRNKETVAERLWYAIANLVYNQTTVEYRGPTLQGFTVSATNVSSQEITVEFIEGTSNGAYFQGVEFCTTCCTNGSNLGLWQFSADGGNTSVTPTSFYWGGPSASWFVATVEGLTAKVNTVMYMLQSLPQCALFNNRGLPAPPFSVQA